MAAALLAGALLSGCAAGLPWSRTDVRVCTAPAQPMVCVAAEPDQPVTFTVDGVVLVPGECASASKPGWVRVQWSRDQQIQGQRRIHVGAHRHVHVALDERARLRVHERVHCRTAER